MKRDARRTDASNRESVRIALGSGLSRRRVASDSSVGLSTLCKWVSVFRPAGPNDQFNIGAEVRRRNYPQGPLRERSRNIVQLSGGWNHALAGGKASLNLAAAVGREFATDNRPDGNSNFYSLSPSLDFTITPRLGGHFFVWWQNERYSVERLEAIEGDLVGIPARNDDLWEVGGGISWNFVPSWSISADVLYIKDDSNIIAVNYSSTEFHLTLRKDF